MDNNKMQRQLGGELVIPVLAVVFTLYFFSSIWNSPWTAQVSAFAVGGILLLVCGIFIIRCGIWLRRGEASLGFSNLFSREDLHTGRIGLLVTTIGFCFLIEMLGFTFTTFLFLSISMIILAKGKRPVFIAMVSAIMALGGWAVFIWAFDTRFPRGWFETTMKAVLANG
ncbi:tripartite tricarboxylate transporter TctB family protein [bacterium]|uniref:tripartite tricarboxylate transporter TctB family protein n=1 Tax=Pacificibacter sp. TaxID=1917866 RepID=UPI002302152B|nr:tripartite tricarboxylate transporter TctB family protein [Planktomarina temperata]MDA9812423.1 tripartite tricarboxylate transporter TctB family protein [bacterium]MDA7469885.1 tripartite tricarboxylate transporter TctB family protein [Planktomarina temperata]MDA7475154.1 tripartite tricarboxylate transporter TctB family protein [Planktomarina temperata]MDA8685369.1 tripartite tricarboxylate transporter TctB family protein [Planktomarina temperata]